jgi:thymidine kinase
VAGSADDIRRAVRPETDMVAVDEAHFFGADLTEVADRVPPTAWSWWWRAWT